jgi:16S rRNA U516 pseudouridylate synthase RsuA-like enzyme
MRINKFLAQATGLSRRAADKAIEEGRVAVNGHAAQLGDSVEESERVTLDGRSITPTVKTITIMLNKPTGYVVSRDGQGSPTIYDLLPDEYRAL